MKVIREKKIVCTMLLSKLLILLFPKKKETGRVLRERISSSLSLFVHVISYSDSLSSNPIT